MKLSSFLALILIFPLMSIVSLLHASNDFQIDVVQYPELSKFVKKYRCPSIEQLAEEEVKANRTTHRPNAFVKKYYTRVDKFEGAALVRVLNAARLRNVINRHNLYHLDVAQPYIGKTICTCIAYMVERGVPKENQISLSMIQQLAFLAEEGLYGKWARDLHHDVGIDHLYSNVLFTANHQLTFVDTDDEACLGSLNRRKLYRIEHLHEFIINSKQYVTAEALQWLENRKNFWLNVAQGKQEDVEAKDLDLSIYDDCGINFKQVRREFDGFREEQNNKRWDQYNKR